ncbi:MAG: DUF445 domain-containing protein [Cellulosilyticaceae bacterium]
MNLEFIMGPIVGGVIGYITNGIAIKMLFRPLNPIYVFGKRVPFTPGIIPKEKKRIAKSVGNVVGNELINQEMLKKNLLSQEMYAKLESGINTWYMQKKNSNETVREVLFSLGTNDMMADGITLAKDKVTEVAYDKIVALELGSIFAESACTEIKGNMGALSMFLNDHLMESAKTKLENIINQMIAEKGQSLIADVVEREGEALLDMTVNDVIQNFSQEVPKIKYILMQQYTKIIETQLTTLLSAVDIPKIVEERINEYDMLELEKLILEIMEKELKAIVNLGALLGAIMGIFMSVF